MNIYNYHQEIQKIKKLTNELEDHGKKFFDDKVLVAGTRCRTTAQELRNILFTLRQYIQKQKETIQKQKQATKGKVQKTNK